MTEIKTKLRHLGAQSVECVTFDLGGCRFESHNGYRDHLKIIENLKKVEKQNIHYSRRVVKSIPDFQICLSGRMVASISSALHVDCFICSSELPQNRVLFYGARFTEEETSSVGKLRLWVAQF